MEQSPAPAENQKEKVAVGPSSIVSDSRAGPLFPGHGNGQKGRLLLLIVIGLNEDVVAEIVGQAVSEDRQTDDVAIFLTDLDRFDVFRDTGCVFEHVPSAVSKSLAPEGLDWDLYLQRRLDLLQTKWRPSAMIPFGAEARRVLNGWRDARNHLVSAGKFSGLNYTGQKPRSGE